MIYEQLQVQGKAGPCQLKDIVHGAVATIGSLVTNLDEDRRP
jgi:hypothetical protein